MLEEILNNKDFHELMLQGVYKSIDILIDQKIEFSIVAATELVDFTPNLPEDLKELLKQPFIVFALGGYTFSSLNLDKDDISFHAGFGSNDFECKVRVKLAGISQIKVGDAIIFVNFSKPVDKASEANLKEKSKNMFLKNNKKLFK